MRKPRLTIVTNNLYVFAGGEKLALDIATGLKDRFEVKVLNPVSSEDSSVVDRKTIEKLFDTKGIRIIDVRSAGMRARAAFVGEPFVLRALGPRAFAVFANTIRKSDVVYLMSQNPVAFLVVLFFTKLFNKRLVLGVHNFSIAKVLKSKGTLKDRIARRNLVALLGRVRYFHVTSKRDFDLLRSLFPKAKVRLIPNLIRNEKKLIAFNSKEFVCLYVGRLEKNQKGIDLLCAIAERTLSKNKAIRFSIVGGGGDGEGLVASLAKKHSGNVEWLGFMSGKDLAKAYNRASLLVFPARYDTFSVVLLEAQGLGLPAVTFDVDGPRDVIKSAFQGTRVQAFDVAKFSNGIGRYYALWRDKKSYKKLRERIRDSAYANYGKERVLGELGSFFTSALR